MPQIENKEILGRILKSTIGVIGRRTSDAYAKMVIENILKELIGKYNFFSYVNIQKETTTEEVKIVEINKNIENVDIKTIGNSIRDFMIKLAQRMGKNAGFYFIREIKEDLPYHYEEEIRELGVDLDFIQSEFIFEIKSSFKFTLTNYDVLKNIFTLLFEILDGKAGRNFAYETVTELVGRLSTQYDTFRYIKINDVRSIQNVDFVTVDRNVDSLDPSEVGASIQKIIQEITNELSSTFHEESPFYFIDNLKNRINVDYIFKLEEMGVNLEVIKLKQTILVKKVVKALIDILSESSTESYAFLILNNIFSKYKDKFTFIDYINIDGNKHSEETNQIKVSDQIETVSPSDLGRAIQKIMENVSTSLGEEAGRFFLDKFRKKIGKAYILRLEEIGVNLHMIELRRTLF